MKSEHELISIVRVFPAASDSGGGNPAPIVIGADQLDAQDMQSIAARFGHESGFIMKSQAPTCDLRMRYFVPNHEMEMCGHATVGGLWLLRRKGLWNGQELSIETLSGKVKARERDGRIEISQPAGRLTSLTDGQTSEIARVLNIRVDEIQGTVINAATSRVKTLVQMSLPVLRSLQPRFSDMEDLCSSIGSTGIYPYAILSKDHHIFEARQFPKSSGYPEDAATGIAATALAYGLRFEKLVPDHLVRVEVHQGVSMGRPSCIHVYLPDEIDECKQCWLGGDVVLDEEIG